MLSNLRCLIFSYSFKKVRTQMILITFHVLLSHTKHKPIVSYTLYGDLECTSPAVPKNNYCTKVTIHIIHIQISPIDNKTLPNTKRP